MELLRFHVLTTIQSLKVQVSDIEKKRNLLKDIKGIFASKVNKKEPFCTRGSTFVLSFLFQMSVNVFEMLLKKAFILQKPVKRVP
jgi:hypothetical protein